VVVRIDLNADVGESPAEDSLDDAALMAFLTSASVACGFHAGSPGRMRSTVVLARTHGVSVGAHPGFLDREGFGRREREVTPSEVEDLVAYQLGALSAIAAGEGVSLRHVKPHGALYSMAGRDAVVADAVARGVSGIDASLVLFAPPHSELIEAGQRAGLRTAAEAFADRAYESDGRLVSRSLPGAVIDDAGVVAARALQIAVDRSVTAHDGSVIALDAETICLHSDTHRAAVLASAIRRALEAGGVEVRPVGRHSDA
jgi:UPF0271 protein